jgi:dTDP-4-amino-4,6-dideoxygalactose transaminase
VRNFGTAKSESEVSELYSKAQHWLNTNGGQQSIDFEDLKGAASSATTDCQPNDNVEAMCVAIDKANIEARPVWKPMHKQPVYCRTSEKGKVKSEKLPSGTECLTYYNSVAYVNGVSEALFKVGMCLPAGPYVSDDDVKYIVETIKSNIIG